MFKVEGREAVGSLKTRTRKLSKEEGPVSRSLRHREYPLT